jgi:protein phosphatase
MPRRSLDDAWDRGPVFTIADGLGGHATGEVASRMAVESLVDSWRSNGPGIRPSRCAPGVRRANIVVLDMSFTDGRTGMATTLTALTLAGREAIIAHVGDCRVYLVRQGQTRQLTVDRSQASEMIRLKMIPAEQAVDHSARNQLSRAVGTNLTVQVEVPGEARAGRHFRPVFGRAVGRCLRRRAHRRRRRTGRPPLAHCRGDADALVDLALSRQAADNVTAVVVHVPSWLPTPAAGVRRRPWFLRGCTP